MILQDCECSVLTGKELWHGAQDSNRSPARFMEEFATQEPSPSGVETNPQRNSQTEEQAELLRCGHKFCRNCLKNGWRERTSAQYAGKMRFGWAQHTSGKLILQKLRIPKILMTAPVVLI